MKIKLKVELMLRDMGEIKSGKVGDTLDVSESVGQFEIAAGRAILVEEKAETPAEEPRKK